MANVRMTGDVILGQIEIGAPPERVFLALTDPSQLQQWWAADEGYQTRNWHLDHRAGGEWRADWVHSVSGHTLHSGGKILVFDPPRAFAYTMSIAMEPDLPETQVFFSLAPTERGTRLCQRHEGFAGHPAAAKDHNEGWTIVLSWLRDYAESP